MGQRRLPTSPPCSRRSHACHRASPPATGECAPTTNLSWPVASPERRDMWLVWGCSLGYINYIYTKTKASILFGCVQKWGSFLQMATLTRDDQPGDLGVPIFRQPLLWKQYPWEVEILQYDNMCINTRTRRHGAIIIGAYFMIQLQLHLVLKLGLQSMPSMYVRASIYIYMCVFRYFCKVMYVCLIDVWGLG